MDYMEAACVHADLLQQLGLTTAGPLLLHPNPLLMTPVKPVLSQPSPSSASVPNLLGCRGSAVGITPQLEITMHHATGYLRHACGH